MTDNSVKVIAKMRKSILACGELPENERIACYNAATRALRALVSDLVDDPVLSIQLIPSENLVANDYNPNKVAQPEMDLLSQSIEADGVTMPIVTYRDDAAKQWVTVDGFHRGKVLKSMKRKYVPVSEIDKPLQERMASTVRHNRARGKHQVDLQGELVKSMISLGLSDSQVADRLGMSEEELLRLKQIVGAARLVAGIEYSTTYGRTDEPPDLLGD